MAETELEDVEDTNISNSQAVEQDVVAKGATATKTQLERQLVVHQQPSDSTFHMPLQNVFDAIARPLSPVHEEEAIASLVQVFPSTHQSIAEPVIISPADTIDDLIAVKGLVQQVSPGDTTAAAACASIQHPLTNS